MAKNHQKSEGPEGGSAESKEAPSFDVSNEIKKIQEQAEKHRNDYLYLRAEFDNYRKHSIKERAEISKYGAEWLVRDLLGVLDNFERALQANVGTENFSNFKQGIEMTAVELKNLLQKHGVEELRCEGQAFDPNLHEALSSEPSSKIPPGHITKVFKKAYKYNEKLVRPAQVAVSQKSES